MQTFLSQGNKVWLMLSIYNALTNEFTKPRLTSGQHSTRVPTLQHAETTAIYFLSFICLLPSIHFWKQTQKARIIEIIFTGRLGETSYVDPPTWNLDCSPHTLCGFITHLKEPQQPTLPFLGRTTRLAWTPELEQSFFSYLIISPQWQWRTSRETCGIRMQREK